MAKQTKFTKKNEFCKNFQSQCHTVVTSGEKKLIFYYYLPIQLFMDIAWEKPVLLRGGKNPAFSI